MPRQVKIWKIVRSPAVPKNWGFPKTSMSDVQLDKAHQTTEHPFTYRDVPVVTLYATPRFKHLGLQFSGNLARKNNAVISKRRNPKNCAFRICRFLSRSALFRAMYSSQS